LDETDIVENVILTEGKKSSIEKQFIREEMNECVRGYIEKLQRVIELSLY